MDSFELNKIMGAVLGTCMVLLALNITANAIFSPATARQARLRHCRAGEAGGRREEGPGAAGSADRRSFLPRPT